MSWKQQQQQQFPLTHISFQFASVLLSSAGTAPRGSEPDTMPTNCCTFTFKCALPNVCALPNGLTGQQAEGIAPPRGSSSSHYMGFPARQPVFAHSGSLKPSCSSLTLIDSILCECFKCWLAGNEAIIMQNAARKPLQIIRDARPSLCIGNEATRGQRASTNILDTLASSSITINGNPINLDTDYWQLFSRPARRTALQRNGQMIGQSTRVDSKPTRTSAVGH